MRIKINIKPTRTELPINGRSIVNSFIHRCIGRNNKYHNSKSNYSVSSLQGGTWIKDTNRISLLSGGYIIVSSLDKEFLDKVVEGALNENFHGDISVSGFEIIEEKLYDGWNHFATLSPFIIKNYIGNDRKKYEFITLDRDDFVARVKSHLRNKISKILPDEDLSKLEVIINNSPSHKIKKILVKNVINKANQCQVSIFCSRRVAEIIYNIGLGQSTGCGFGTVYKTENHSLYRNSVGDRIEKIECAH